VESEKGLDTCVSRFVAEGALEYTTQELNADVIYAVAADANGDIFVCGSRTGGRLAVTHDAAQRAFGGGSVDSFVAKLKGGDGDIIYASYLGGSKRDGAYEVAVTSAGDAVITGVTDSPDFPTTPGVFQPEFVAQGGLQGFITKMDPPPGALIFIPGIMGSQLCKVGTSGEDYVFPSKFHSEWKQLSLDPDGPQVAIEARDILTQSFGYAGLMSGLSQMGYTIYNGYEMPERRRPSGQGCDTSQRNRQPKPNLFPFP
jgi:hypothetical protein